MIFRTYSIELKTEVTAPFTVLLKKNKKKKNKEKKKGKRRIKRA